LVEHGESADKLFTLFFVSKKTFVQLLSLLSAPESVKRKNSLVILWASRFHHDPRTLQGKAFVQNEGKEAFQCEKLL